MRVFILTFILSLSFSLVSYAESRLELQEFLNLAEQNDPQFKRILKDKDQLNFIVDLGLPSRKVTLSGQYELGFDLDGDEDTRSLTGLLTKDIIESGTSLSVGYTRTSQPDRNEEVTEVRIEQSLYKNLLGRDVRLQKKALKEESQVVRLEVLEDYETYVSDILGEYYDYKKAYLDLSLANIAYEDVKKLRDNVAERLEKKVATSTDLDRSDLLLILSHEDLLNKRQEFESKGEAIKRILGSNQLKKPSQQALLLRGDFYKNNPEKEKKVYHDLRVFQIAELKESIAAKEVTLAKREDDPDLNLIGGYNNDRSNRFSTSVNRNEAVVGLSLEIPLWDTQAKAQVKSSVLELSKYNLEKGVLVRTLDQDFQQLSHQLKELKGRVNLSDQKIKLTRRILKDEEDRYGVGKIDLEELLETKQDYYEYRFQHQTEVLEYNKLMLQWLALNDQLLESKHLLR